ncbi:hypothetical protein [Candidatus Wolbachia massiliensis]|uniref:Uncharacterized protein n=1 Tax=Candidatus Wolbachia massiliensis TaxID=1845000 RepID=A0A7L7YRQ3_9RICK|nr:hypothetical protein [Candidatus Wolbachia massiliensis]QOD38347.1 hypothetical protein ID128_00185 [Candidatus Wolbachia massiliensis]
MPNISKMNQELVRAFNVNLCYNDIAVTNLTVRNVYQGPHKEDHIVILFDKSMSANQCMKYLDNMKERIVETFCGDESTAGISFNTKFFPFDFNKKQLIKDGKGRYRFSVPIDKSVILNLKCLLANGLAKDITGAMGRSFGEEYAEEHTDDASFDRKSYLYCMRFHDTRLQEYFIKSFSLKVKGYKSGPENIDDFLKVKDNCVYIKANVFDKIEFIKEIVEDKTSLICRDFQVPSSEDKIIEGLKFPIIDLLNEIGLPTDSIFHVSYTGSSENSILIPAATKVISNIEYYEFLSKREADYINNVFGMAVLRDIEGYTSPKHLPIFGNRGIYGIDFYNRNISYCIMSKIIESSVINENHELSIEPELFARALSPDQEPDGRGEESSYWRTRVSSPGGSHKEHPRHQDEQIKGDPRQASEKGAGKATGRGKGTGGMLFHTIDSSKPTGQFLGAAALGDVQGASGELFAPSKSDEYSKAEPKEDTASKSGSESPTKIHRGGRFCSQRKPQSNPSSGSSTPSEEPSVPNTDDRSTMKKVLSYLPPSPFRRNSNKQGRDSKISVKTDPGDIKKNQSDPKQRNTYPTRKKGGGDLFSKEKGSPILTDIRQLSETEGALPVIDTDLKSNDECKVKGQQLKPTNVSVSRNNSNSSQKSRDSGFKSGGSSLERPSAAKVKQQPHLGSGGEDEGSSSSLSGLNNTFEPSVRRKSYALPRASLANKAPTSSSSVLRNAPKDASDSNDQGKFFRHSFPSEPLTSISKISVETVVGAAFRGLSPSLLTKITKNIQEKPRDEQSKLLEQLNRQRAKDGLNSFFGNWG